MRFRATFDGKEHDVITGREAGTVIVDGQEFSGSVEVPAENRRVVRIAEHRFDLRVVEGDVSEGTFVLDLSGERITVEVAKIALRAVRGPPPPRKTGKVPEAKVVAKADAAVGEGIRAPMPGRVVEVFIEAGDEVDSGDVVLILEAMKMENELRAPGKAIVKSVNVQPGDSVAGNQLLVALD